MPSQNYTDKQLLDSIAYADPEGNHHLARGQMAYMVLTPAERKPINAAICSLAKGIPKLGPIIAIEVLDAIAQLCEEKEW